MNCKGLIICGYPGVGKTSIAGWNNCVDLDSSYFSHDENNKSLIPIVWVPRYCYVAIDIALQGYTVLLSTHNTVLDFFKQHPIPKQVAGPIIFCPRQTMKDDWDARLKKRYENDPTQKNLNAYHGAIDYWDNKISHLYHSGYPVSSPDAIDYDLKNYILSLQNTYLHEE